MNKEPKPSIIDLMNAEAEALAPRLPQIIMAYLKSRWWWVAATPKP